MPKLHWKERFGREGICNFRENYDFYWKWLLSKTASCFYIKNLPETVDEFYVKSSLLVDGDICFTDFDSGKLYAVNGAPGGKPDEYHRPSVYTVANPVLGSRVVYDGIDGVIVYNTPLDAYIPGGLSGLISQTATLLADNVISINCCQINTRVTAIFTADSEGQAASGESILKSIYTGHPYKIMRSDLIDKITVNPIATTNTSQSISELVELNNFIIANYFQSIGVKSNNIRKKEHLINAEIDAQNDYLQISIFEILTSWQKGFDKVNELFGTDIHVEINPALINTILGDDEDDGNSVDSDLGASSDSDTDITEDVSEELQPNGAESVNGDDADDDFNNGDSSVDSIAEEVEEQAEQVEEIVDMINGKDDDTDVDETEHDREHNDVE